MQFLLLVHIVVGNGSNIRRGFVTTAHTNAYMIKIINQYNLSKRRCYNWKF